MTARRAIILCSVCLIGLGGALGWRAWRRPRQAGPAEMHVMISATPLEAMSDPPGDPQPAVINVNVPRDLYAGLDPTYRCLENVSVALMPTRKGFVDMPAGAFGIRASVKGPLVNWEENYRIDYRISKNQLLGDKQGVCEGDFDVRTKAGHIGFHFSATIAFRPRGADAPDSFEAVEARIIWKGPVVLPDK